MLDEICELMVLNGSGYTSGVWGRLVSAADLDEEVRLNGNLEDICGVRLAMLDRNRKISIVRKD